MRATDLLLIDAGFRLLLGLTLVMLPKMLMAMLGLPKTPEAFWPRMLGALLLGLGITLVLEAKYPAMRGLGLAGAVVLNVIVAFTLASHLFAGRLDVPRRGRLVMWAAVALMVLLALLELAFV